ncbi:MAG: hypothetical protein CME16_01920 [Gemmatimonadetes bacterium]|nr:hypothetical protein [Gemmatimonadota bacterium]
MGKWIQRASMPTPRHDLQAIAVGEKIYAISGGGDLTSEVVEIYDVEHDVWSPGPSITTKRGWFGAVLLGQKIYAMGGKTVRPEEEIERTGDPGKYDIRDSLEVLDLASCRWSFLPPMSATRAGLVATVCKGRIYALGGNAMNSETRSGGPHLDRVEVYDPHSGQWAMGVPMPLGLQGPSVATVDDRIYLTSGIGGPEGKANSRTYAFDPDTEKWDSLAPVPTPRCDSGVAVLDRKIYTFGGWGNGYHDEVEIYDIDADSWSSDSPMPDKKAWLAAATVGERIFVMGGAYKLRDAPGFKWIDDLHEFAC